MSFSSETRVRAVRKQYPCDACPKPIEIGQPAIRWAGLTDGQFGTCVYHPECRAAEIAFNRELGDYWDWTGLHDIEWDDHAWLLAKHPVVAARWDITAETIRQHEEEREARRIAWAKAKEPHP